MLRDTEERDAILTMDWRGTGTMTVDGQSCTLANYRGQVRYSRARHAHRLRVRATPTASRARVTVQVIAGAMAWNETAPGVGATPAPNTVTERLVQLWSLPYSVYKAAMLAGANAKMTLEGGVVYLSYPLPAPLTGTARVALNTTDADRAHDGQWREVPIELLDRSRRTARRQRRHRNDVHRTTRN